MDLKSAKVLAERLSPLYDTALFHCQQAAEKSIKAFLLFEDILFDKTHNLVRIIDQAADKNTGFNSFKERMDRLTPYAQIFRYPYGVPAPSAREFLDAFQAARDIYLFVLDLLPEETHPEDAQLDD